MYSIGEAKTIVETVLVQIFLNVCCCRVNDFPELQAAKTAAQISGAVVAFPVSRLRLNCCFLIFSANSMPRIVTAAVSNRLNPVHRQEDDFPVEVPPLEKLSRRTRFHHARRYDFTPLFSSVCTRTGCIRAYAKDKPRIVYAV